MLSKIPLPLNTCLSSREKFLIASHSSETLSHSNEVDRRRSIAHGYRFMLVYTLSRKIPVNAEVTMVLANRRSRTLYGTEYSASDCSCRCSGCEICRLLLPRTLDSSTLYHFFALFATGEYGSGRVSKSEQIGKEEELCEEHSAFILIVATARIPESFGDSRRISIRTGDNGVSTKFGRVRLTPAEQLSFAVFIYTIQVYHALADCRSRYSR